MATLEMTFTKGALDKASHTGGAARGALGAQASVG